MPYSVSLMAISILSFRHCGGLFEWSTHSWGAGCDCFGVDGEMTVYAKPSFMVTHTILSLQRSSQVLYAYQCTRIPTMAVRHRARFGNENDPSAASAVCVVKGK